MVSTPSVKRDFPVASSSAGDTASDSFSLAPSSTKRGRKAADTCMLCWMSWSSPNPFKNHVSETLPRNRGSGAVCDVCAGCWNWAKDSREKKAFAEMQKKDKELHDDFMDQREEYINIRNGEPHKGKSSVRARPKSRDGPLTTISSHQVIDVRGTVRMGIFWSVPVYKAYWKQEPNKKLLQLVDYGAGPILGVVRKSHEDPKDVPDGVVVLDKVFKTGVDKVVEVDRSDQHVREGQGEDTWKKMVATQSVTAKEVKCGDDPKDRALQYSEKKPGDPKMEMKAATTWHPSSRAFRSNPPAKVRRVVSLTMTATTSRRMLDRQKLGHTFLLRRHWGPNHKNDPVCNQQGTQQGNPQNSNAFGNG